LPTSLCLLPRGCTSCWGSAGGGLGVPISCLHWVGCATRLSCKMRVQVQLSNPESVSPSLERVGLRKWEWGSAWGPRYPQFSSKGLLWFPLTQGGDRGNEHISPAFLLSFLPSITDQKSSVRCCLWAGEHGSVQAPTSSGQICAGSGAEQLNFSSAGIPEPVL